MDASPWLLAAAALHLGFQATVTALVYPTLGEDVGSGAGAEEAWARRESRHVRRITPLVGVVYGLLGAAVVAAVATSTPLAVPAASAYVVLLLVTGLGAAPQHGRLVREWDATAYARLVVADRVRLGLAVVLVALAVVAAV